MVLTQHGTSGTKMCAYLPIVRGSGAGRIEAGIKNRDARNANELIAEIQSA